MYVFYLSIVGLLYRPEAKNSNLLHRTWLFRGAIQGCLVGSRRSIDIFHVSTRTLADSWLALLRRSVQPNEQAVNHAYGKEQVDDTHRLDKHHNRDSNNPAHQRSL